MRAEVVVKERRAGMVEARSGLPRWAEATLALAGLVVSAPVIALTGSTKASSSLGDSRLGDERSMNFAAADGQPHCA